MALGLLLLMPRMAADKKLLFRPDFVAQNRFDYARICGGTALVVNEWPFDASTSAGWSSGLRHAMSIWQYVQHFLAMAELVIYVDSDAHVVNALCPEDWMPPSPVAVGRDFYVTFHPRAGPINLTRATGTLNVAKYKPSCGATEYPCNRGEFQKRTQVNSGLMAFRRGGPRREASDAVRQRPSGSRARSAERSPRQSANSSAVPLIHHLLREHPTPRHQQKVEQVFINDVLEQDGCDLWLTHPMSTSTPRSRVLSRPQRKPGCFEWEQLPVNLNAFGRPPKCLGHVSKEREGVSTYIMDGEAPLLLHWPGTYMGYPPLPCSVTEMMGRLHEASLRLSRLPSRYSRGRSPKESFIIFSIIGAFANP